MTDILRDKLFLISKAVIRTTIVILNNIYSIPTYVIWMMILLPVKKCHPNLYYKIEGLLFHWLLSQVSLWAHTAGYDVIELGDDITPCRKKSKRTLVIANHQSTADVPLMMSCFNAKSDILPNIMWIMDRLFKYTNFGIVSLLHLDFFITSGKAKRDISIQQLKKHITKAFIPRRRNWMVLFPEGGFLRKRREISQLYAQKNNLPVLQNVSLPRIGALQAIFEVLPPISKIESITSSSSSSSNPSSELKSQISNNHKNSNNINNNNNSTTSLNNNVHLDSKHIHNNNNNNNDICLNNNNNNNINGNIINNNCYNKNVDNNNSHNSHTNNNSINCKKSIINGSVLNNTANKDHFQKNQSVITKDSSKVNTITSSVENCTNEKIIDNSEHTEATVLDYILDITIAYPNGEPLDLPSIVHGLRYPCQTYFYYRLYHSSEVPKDGIALTNWLFDRWAEKDQILKEYYKTGKFPLKISSPLHNSSNHSNNSSSSSSPSLSSSPSQSLSWTSTIPPTIVQQDTLRYIIINLFFITSTYVHIQMFYTLLNYCNLYVYSFM